MGEYMKINKKQIIFLTLAFAVCIAVYLNWRFLDPVAPEIENPTAGEVQPEDKTLGQAQLVETVAKDVAAYFTECRMNKQQTRDEALELLKTVSESSEASAEAKEKAGNDMVKLAHHTDTEGTIESLVKAKGFEECMVYITDETVNVVVATPGLSPEQAAQINELVMAESGKAASAVKIMEIKTES